MEREQYLAAIKTRMPEKRYIHTLGVMETAIALAKIYGEDEKKAETAAILHDISKYADIDWMEQIVQQQKLDQQLLGWGSELLHGPVGAYIAKSEFGITDEDILNAIRFHTTGRVAMSRLEKIIFVADMIDSLHTWYRIDELVKLVQFVGVKRPNAEARTEYPVLMVEVPQIDLSSTLIRDRLATGKTVTFLLPEAVETFIREEGLYGTRTVSSSD